MATFSTGQAVEISCEVRPGPFPGEFLVAFETADGPVSGFVREENLKRTGDSDGYVFAIVREVSADTITVMVRGSFFTTNGLAHLRREWANSHVQEARA
jgi:hypothetical protein